MIMYWPYDFEISLNGKKEPFFVDEPKRLEVLATLAVCEEADWSIEHNDGPILIVLLNPQRAFVMWMREEGDAGMHAVDPNADGSDSQEFVLSNGQVDEFSNFDTVSRELALDAVAHFLRARAPSPQLQWQEP